MVIVWICSVSCLICISCYACKINNHHCLCDTPSGNATPTTSLACERRARLSVSHLQILDEIDEHGIKIYHLPDAESDEDEEFKEQTRILKVDHTFIISVAQTPGAHHFTNIKYN